MHDVPYAHQQPPPEHSAGVKIRKVLLLESPLLQQDDGQRIAHGQRRGRACGGREVEGTGFLGNADVQVDRGSPGEGGAGVARHGDQRQAKPLDTRQQEGDFLGFAGIGDRQDHILAGDHPHVAMSCFAGVNEERRRPGARQGGGDLAAHVSGLAQADDHDPGLVALRLDADSAGLEHRLTQPRNKGPNCIGLNFQHAACRGQGVDGFLGHGRDSISQRQESRGLGGRPPRRRRLIGRRCIPAGLAAAAAGVDCALLRPAMHRSPMDPKEIANLIEAGLPGARAEVRTDGQGHYEALVIADEFAGLRSVRRHQRVYATLGDRVGGEITRWRSGPSLRTNGGIALTRPRRT